MLFRSAAIGQLRRACGPMTAQTGQPSGDSSGRSYEAPEGLVFCGGGGIKRVIEYVILKNAPDQWDARVTVNGETVRAMTAYSYFGNEPEPEGFVVALLGEDRSEFLVYDRNGEAWVEYGDYAYRPCNCSADGCRQGFGAEVKGCIRDQLCRSMRF